jgi:hypothetical protein
MKLAKDFFNAETGGRDLPNPVSSKPDIYWEVLID